MPIAKKQKKKALASLFFTFCLVCGFQVSGKTSYKGKSETICQLTTVYETNHYHLCIFKKRNKYWSKPIL